MSKLWHRPFVNAARRCKGPTIALLGAMALVGLLTSNSLVAQAEEGGGNNGTTTTPSDAPTDIIGRNLAQLVGDWYIVFVAPIGAMGAFFSGSTTVSNLTFGAIQESVAGDIASVFCSLRVRPAALRGA